MPNIHLTPSDIDWTTLNRGGNFFRTRKAILVGQDKIIFRPTLIAVLFYILIIYFGYSAVNSEIVHKIHDSLTFRQYMGIFFSILLEAGGILSFWFGIRPVRFDRSIGIFYRGWRIPGSKIDNVDRKKAANYKYIPLNEIFSLQILSHLYNRGGYGYQLNLVLNNSKRIYVVGHKDIKQIRCDAKLLSSFLDIPIWEAIDLKSSEG